MVRKLARRVAPAIVGLATLGLLGPAAPAAAAPPTRVEFTVPLSGPHFLSGPCGTEILQDGVLHVVSTEYDDGRVIEHVRVDVVLTANGKVAYEQPTFTVVVDPGDGTITLTGTLINIHAPGDGLLLQDVGRIVRDLATFDILSVSGRWMFLDGDLEKVCLYFAAAP